MQNRSKISTDVNVKCKESQDITSPEIISIFYDVFSFGPIKWRSLMGSPFDREICRVGRRFDMQINSTNPLKRNYNPSTTKNNLTLIIISTKAKGTLLTCLISFAVWKIKIFFLSAELKIGRQDTKNKTSHD